MRLIRRKESDSGTNDTRAVDSARENSKLQKDTHIYSLTSSSDNKRNTEAQCDIDKQQQQIKREKSTRKAQREREKREKEREKRER